MVFVFTAIILFFTFLFWNIYRLNRTANTKPASKKRAKRPENGILSFIRINSSSGTGIAAFMEPLSMPLSN
jgi:hypothetical protein